MRFATVLRVRSRLTKGLAVRQFGNDLSQSLDGLFGSNFSIKGAFAAIPIRVRNDFWQALG
jgi:hypothetical protein